MDDYTRYSKLTATLKPYDGAGKSQIYGVLSRLLETLKAPDKAAFAKLSDLIQQAL
jgi:hypothetical protein